MRVNIVVVNNDDLFIEYEWGSSAEFKEAVERRTAEAEPIPELDFVVHTFDCKENDMEMHWNEEQLRTRSIVSMQDLYDLISSCQKL